ncbi:MAG: hypothetical protein QG583_717 [Patescibacteria group bacterium]|nr:hypothetical protein [Patescibacteria group bacterium]
MNESGRKYLMKDPEVRKEVEEISAKHYESKEISDAVIKRFFVLPDGVYLSQEEKEDFRIFVEYASKRLIGGQMQHLHPELQNKENALLLLQKTKNAKSSLSFHDITHAIITYEDQKKTTPGFATNYAINDYDLVAEELRVNMWEGVISKYSIFIALMDENKKQEWVSDFEKWYEKALEKKDPDFMKMREKILDAVKKCDSSDFDSVFDAYQNITFLFAGEVNTMNFKIFFEHSEESIKEMEAIYEEMTEMIKIQPDPKLISLAKSVFENYDKNPKILYDEFKRICGPLIKNLKKRSTV